MRLKPAAEGESSKGGVEVSEDLLGQGGQRVAVQGEQGEGGDPAEGATWQRPQKIEPKVQNLQHFVDKLNKHFLQNHRTNIIMNFMDCKWYNAKYLETIRCYKMCCMSQTAAG